VYACGLNTDSTSLPLGSSAPIYVSSPIQANFTNEVAFISTMGSSSVAVDVLGNFFAWGSNLNGELCIGNQSMSVPTQLPISVGSGTIVDVKLSRFTLSVHTISSSGTDQLWVCGNNTFGGLGILSPSTGLPPVYVSALTQIPISSNVLASGNQISSISVLDSNLFALNSAGSLFGQGFITRVPAINDTYSVPSFIFGYSSSNPSTPVQFGTIRAGNQVSAAIVAETGQLFVWGAQKVPNNYLTADLSQFHVYQPLEHPFFKGLNVTQIYLGTTSLVNANQSNVLNTHYKSMTFFAVQNTSQVYCWGSNELYQLGLGFKNSTFDLTGVPMNLIINPYSNYTTVQKITPSGRSVLSLTYQSNVPVPPTPSNPFPQRTSFELYLWGDNSVGQLGMGLVSQVPAPLPPIPTTPVTDIAVGDWHSLYLQSDGTVYSTGYSSTGYSSDGRIGQSGLQLSTVFRPITLTGVPIAKVFAGAAWSFYLAQNGSLYASGSNEFGQLGFPSSVTDVKTPTLVPFTPALGISIVTISSSLGDGAHTLMLMSDGSVYATGLNNVGQLGLGDYVNRYGFTKVPIPQVNGLNAIEIAAGTDHSLVLLGSRPCPNDCDGRGQCNEVLGTCTCFQLPNFMGGGYYTGPDCSAVGCLEPLCNGYGTCNLNNGRCICDSKHSGRSCEYLVCPNECSGTGTCNQNTGICQCDPGYSGDDCSIGGANQMKANLFTVLLLALFITLFSLM